ncbi:hypothetical protein BSKO_13720 [Bryopsis sp. KO-2023]|nr:hypothetical protein BSKO_13720 [Bryopsis sp. KO-2023]
MDSRRSFKDRLRETTEKLKNFSVTDPFEKKINDLVLRATSEMWINPDWSINMELVDLINTNQGDATYEKVFRCLRRRLGNRDPKVQLFTLTLLETCVKNCGASFQSALAESDVWADVSVMPEPARRNELQVVDKVLLMVEDFARTLRPHKFQKAYVELQASGVRFPERPAEEVGAGMVVEPTPAGIQGDQGVSGLSEADQAAVQEALRDLEQQSRRAPPRTTPAAAPMDTTTATPEQIEKIKADLGTARNSVDLLRDTLSTIPADQPGQVGQDFIKELAEQCNGMKPRVGLLIEQTDVEETVMVEALALYEALEITLMNYDEMLARAAAGPGQEEPRLPTSTGVMNAEPDLLGRLDSEDAEPTLVSNRRDGAGGEASPQPQTQPANQGNPFDFLGAVDQQPAAQKPAADAFSELAAAKNGTTDAFDALVTERDRNSARGSGSENARSNPTSPVSGQSQPTVLSPPPPPPPPAAAQPGSNQDDQVDLISF